MLTDRQLPLQLLVILVVAAAAILARPQQGTARQNDYKIVVSKADQILDLYQGNRLVKSYKICLGVDPSGPKRITGDSKTPEGEYFICYKTESSNYCRFLGISYPTWEDAVQAFESGRISRNDRDLIISRAKNGQTPPWNTILGGWVGIHGYPTDEYKKMWTVLMYPKPHNWTDGCIAMWDFEIEELFSLVEIGTPVHIRP